MWIVDQPHQSIPPTDLNCQQYLTIERHFKDTAFLKSKSRWRLFGLELKFVDLQTSIL